MAQTYFFGPPAGGAGVGVKVTDTSPQIAPGRLGVTAIVSAFSKGITSVPSRVLDRTHFGRVSGRVLATDFGGEASLAFLQAAAGAGELYNYRVPASTGLEDAIGTLRLFGRKCLSSRVETRAVAAVNEREIALRAYALSPGDWSGPEFNFGGKVDDTTIADDTIELSTDYSSLWLADELVGTKFTIGSWATVLTVTSNTAGDGSTGPVLTFDRGFTGYAAAAAEVLFTLTRTSVDSDDAVMAATVLVADGGSDPNATSRLDVALDGTGIRTFDAFELDDLATLTEDLNAAIASGYAEVGFDATGQTSGDLGAPESRPCNWSGIALPDDSNLGKALVTNGKVYFQIHEFVIDTAAGGKPKLSAVPTFPAGVRPHIYQATFSNATTAAVTVVDPYTGEVLVPAADMPALTTGSAYKGPQVGGSGLGFLSTFTIAADGTISAGTIVRLYVLPLPTNLRLAAGRLFAAAWSGAGYAPTSTDPGSNPARPGPTSSWAVIDNGPDWVKLAGGSTDFATALQAPKAPWLRGTDTTASVDTTGGLTFIIQAIIDSNAESAVTVNIVDAGVITKAAFAALLNANGPFAAIATAEVDSTNHLVVWMDRGDAGALVALKATTGTANAAVGIANNTTGTGQSGAPVRIQFAQALRNARPEALAVTSDDIVNALAIDPDSALVRLVQSTAGLVTLLFPGVTDATVINAALDFCQTYGCWALFDTPQSVTSELAAVAARRTNYALNPFGQWFWPSWGRTSRSPRVDGGRETVPLTGVLAGAAARWANDRTDGQGFHKAFAGQKAAISPYISKGVRDPATAPTPQQLLAAPRVRDEVLNPGGICAIVDSGPTVYPFGDEILSASGKGTSWAHKQKSTLHIAALLRANGDQFIYQLNNPGLRSEIVSFVIDLFEPLFRAGWFKTLEDGQAETFQNCVSIQCDSVNNPSEISETGTLVCAIRFQIADTTKVVEFSIGTKGIAVSA